ncbi:MAG: carboxymuconolactone decarboxylase family protein [Erysipelotrichaceae bacterium]
MAVKQTAGRNQLGEFASKFAQLNDDVLFGEVWSREEKLSLKMRSIITVVSLMSQGLIDTSFVHHLENARNNGVTKEEIAEIITHNAFYAGWPKAWAAFREAKEVWKEESDDLKQKHQGEMMFPIGKTNDGFKQYFTGNSYLYPVSDEQVKMFNVTFEPGCRNFYHIHHANKGGGQILICIAGEGYYKEEGKEKVLMKPGDCINIPAGVKHWHGAKENSWFSHLAIEVPGENTYTEWLEKGEE